MNKRKVENKFWIVDSLNEISKDPQTTSVSYYHKRKLVDLSYLKQVYIPLKAGRGRPATNFEVSGKGRGYLALSKNWKRA